VLTSAKHFFTHTIGEYDQWAIEYGYEKFAGAATTAAEKPFLLKIAGESGQPGHRYMSDEQADSFDPYAVRFDHSRDPVNYSAKVLQASANIKDYAIKNLPRPGENYARRTQKSELLFRALGRFIESVGGRYLAAEDVGTSTADAEIVARETRHITGLPIEKGGSGDPSPMTAWGVVCGMRAAIEEAGIGDGFDGVRVAVQGAGHVGGDVVRHLLAAGARVTVSDIYADRVDPLVALGAEAADPTAIHAVDCDVYSPCALGAVIRPETVQGLRCRVVAGAANNQLLDGSMGDALHARGILYTPDFVINAGGVINIGEELGRPYDADRARESVERIADTLRAVFARAKADGVPTHIAADRLAEERIAAARAADPDPLSGLRPAG